MLTITIKLGHLIVLGAFVLLAGGLLGYLIGEFRMFKLIVKQQLKALKAKDFHDSIH